MSPVEALEVHLRMDPHDDEGWLVYGDWLTEQGDVRGQLVALHRRLSGVSAAEAGAIEAQINSIQADHEGMWLGGWRPPPSARLEWRYGFVWGVRLRQHTDLSGVLRGLCSVPAGRLLSRLSLDGSGLGADGAEAVFGGRGGAGVFDTLVEVDLGSNWLGDRGAEILARAARAGAFRSLAALSLYCNAMGPDAARVLAEAELFASVSTLDLSYNALGDQGVSALADALPDDAPLSALNLWGCAVGDAGVVALARSRCLGSLRLLTLRDNVVGDVGALALARSGVLRGLQVLDLSDNPVGVAGARALAVSAAEQRCELRL
ncbi:MAG TPA: TIGR02996 domain-containing protein [Deltaproteobacteria bacterium]|nr:TIGR02996 domain-containing protein [Deltaproteobacteria bacterium]